MIRWQMGRVTRLAIALLACLLVLATCGLPDDETATMIDAADLPAGIRPGALPTPTPTPVEASASGPGSEQIHMMQGNRLVIVERGIESDPARLMEVLLGGTVPAEATQGIFTAIFRGARVQGVEVNPLQQLAIVDLAPGSLDPRNSEQRLAFAQIVYTLTSLPGIEVVQFVQSDPENPGAAPEGLAVQTDTGSTVQGELVSRANFSLLTPPLAQPAFDIDIPTPTPVPGPDAVELSDVSVWLLDSQGQLTKSTRRIELSALNLANNLLEGIFPDDKALDYQTAIPLDAKIIDISVESFDVAEVDAQNFEVVRTRNIALVNLEPGSLPIDDVDLYFTGAQFVFTLTELDSIDQVVFFVDGVAVVMNADGDTLPFDPAFPNGLQRADFLLALSGSWPERYVRVDLEQPEAEQGDAEPGDAEQGDAGATDVEPATAEPTPTPG